MAASAYARENRGPRSTAGSLLRNNAPRLLRVGHVFGGASGRCSQRRWRGFAPEDEVLGLVDELVVVSSQSVHQPLRGQVVRVPRRNLRPGPRLSVSELECFVD